MEEKTSKNLKINLLITLVIGILGFVSNRYFAKYMGIETLGLMKLFTQMVAYLSLVDLGISNASSYALYKPLAENNENQINIIVSTIDSFYKKISLSIIGLGGILSLVLPFFIKNISYGKLIYVYWLLYVVNTAIGYMFAKYSIIFIANQEYGFVRKVQGSGRIIFQVFQILFLIKFQSFMLFIITMIFENLYNYYFYLKHYKKYYTYIKKVKKRDLNIIKDMKNLFWHKIAGLIVYNTDYIILTKFTSLSIVGIYSSYLIVTQILITLLNVLTAVLTPKIGLFVAQNNKNKIYNYWRELYGVYVYISTVFIICTYNLILPFVNLWLGKEFLLSKLTIILILINLFIQLTREITDIFKTSCGFFDDIYTPVLESTLNLIFSLVLVIKLGLNGVIIGTIISNLIVIVLLKPILVFKRCFAKKELDYLKVSAKLFFLSGISIYIIQIFKNKFIKINMLEIFSWSKFIYNCIILGIIAVVMALMIFMTDKYFRNFIKSFHKVKHQI